MDISHEELTKIIDYNIDTGVFTWKIKPSAKVKIGDKAGCNHRGYIAISVNKQFIYAHRLAWFYVYKKWPKYHVDHIDMDRSNNRISNLRDVPIKQNLWNRKNPNKTNKSTGTLGVRSQKDGYYIAQIKANNKNHYLGTFDNIIDAEKAYKEAKKIYHKI
jgi:hypothetical protein